MGHSTTASAVEVSGASVRARMVATREPSCSTQTAGCWWPDGGSSTRHMILPTGSCCGTDEAGRSIHLSAASASWSPTSEPGPTASAPSTSRPMGGSLSGAGSTRASAWPDTLRVRNARNFSPARGREVLVVLGGGPVAAPLPADAGEGSVDDVAAVDHARGAAGTGGGSPPPGGRGPAGTPEL